MSIWGVFQPLHHFRTSDGQLLWLTLLYGHSSLFFTSPVHISPPTPQTVNSIRFTNSKNATPSVATEVLLFPHATRLVIKHVYSFFISLPVFPFIQFPSPVCRLRWHEPEELIKMEKTSIYNVSLFQIWETWREAYLCLMIHYFHLLIYWHVQCNLIHKQNLKDASLGFLFVFLKRIKSHQVYYQL